MPTINVHVEFIDELLGTSSSDPEIHRRFIASKAPDAPSREEEVAALGTEAVEERGMTVFPKTEDGMPYMWDYQVKGFFKDACGMLREADGKKSKTLRAYKKRIDGLIFAYPRRIMLTMPPGGRIGDCERPLRAQTAQGERVALAHSESLPEGTQMDFAVEIDRADLVPLVVEWLQYGIKRGMGQWRNSGKGRFMCMATDDGGKVLLDTFGS